MRLLFLLFLVVALFYFWHTPEMAELNAPQPPARPKVPVPEQDKVFDYSGEQIAYDVLLGKVRIGQAKYENIKKVFLGDVPAQLIAFETAAMRFHDRETIYAQAQSFLPLRIERKVSQLLKPEKIIEEYDQDKFTLTITKKRFTEEKMVIRKDGPIHNSILLPYFVRRQKDLEVGWSFEANLPQRKYRITLKSIEEVEVPAGRFSAYYFESDMAEGKQIRIWISTDERRIPLRLEGTGALGYKLLMREYSRPSNN